MNGFCEISVFKCPSCGFVHGGVVLGGYVKHCNSCAMKGYCPVMENDKIPIYESLCSECLIYYVKKLTGVEL